MCNREQQGWLQWQRLWQPGLQDLLLQGPPHLLVIVVVVVVVISDHDGL